MATDTFCSNCDYIKLFDSGFGWSGWSFARTGAGLKAFSEISGRKFAEKLMKSLDGHFNWFHGWVGYQYPVFIEEGGDFIGLANASPVMSYARYLQMETIPPINV